VSEPSPGGELLIAVNADPDSRLRYLLRLPLGAGMVFRTSGTLAARQGDVLLPGRRQGVAIRASDRRAGTGVEEQRNSH
jgi:hypothetical protein